VAYKNDIAPGKNTATLTLASGKVINLDTNRTSVIVSDSVKTVTALTAATPRGGTYQFTLPDGSKVWLNADSKLEFPSRFNGSERNISLSGEAYFEIAKDKAHPFIVRTKNQEVTVLGTHFNISSYADEALTTTTLAEGSVKVSAFDSATGRQVAVLKPNQQAIQNPTGGMQVRQVDVSEALAWKNGEFVFDDEPLESIMRKVARWYDVDVVYEANAPKDVTLGGYVSRTRNISVVLEQMERTGKVKFKIAGRTVHVQN